MQINLNCNRPKPQFGMAFRRPETHEIKGFTEYLSWNANEYLQALRRKGLIQFDAEQSKLKRFDIKYNCIEDSIDVIENTTGEVIATFVDSVTKTGLEIPSEKKYPGRKLFAELFNPKRFLPQNLYLAGEKAKALEAEAIKKENLF